MKPYPIIATFSLSIRSSKSAVELSRAQIHPLSQVVLTRSKSDYFYRAHYFISGRVSPIRSGLAARCEAVASKEFCADRSGLAARCEAVASKEFRADRSGLAARCDAVASKEFRADRSGFAARCEAVASQEFRADRSGFAARGEAVASQRISGDRSGLAARCEAVASKEFRAIAPASPPDVRQGFALPVVLSQIYLGLCPWFGLCPLAV